MEKGNLDYKSVDVQLSLLLANRLVFETKEEFADYAGFRALLSNNPVTKMPHGDKVALLGRLTKDFLLEGTGYDSFDFFFEQYGAVSGFYRNNILGRKTLSTPDCAVRMARSLFHTHRRSGVRKLDAVLEQLYDFQLEAPRRPYLDVDLLLLMIIGALPPMNTRGPREDPDFREEWVRVRDYLHQADGFRRMYEDNPLLEEIERDVDGGRVPLNRLSFLDAMTSFNGYLGRASGPKDIGKEYRYYEVDGLWQNYRDGSLEGRNTYYQFLYTGQGYNFTVYEIFLSRIRKATYHGFFEYEEKGFSFCLVHPKGGYESLRGKPIGNNHVAWYLVEADDSTAPTRIRLTLFKGGKGFDLFLDTLVKVGEDKAAEIQAAIDSPGVETVDVFADYACIYPLAQGVYAVTKTHLYLIDPESEGHFFKVPKELDDRLDTITVDSVAGALSVGKDEDWWLGFEPIALYISPDRFDECGVERVDRID